MHRDRLRELAPRASAGRFVLRRDWRRVFLDGRRNSRNNRLESLWKKGRRVRRVLELGRGLRRSAMLAMTPRQNGRSALMLRIDFVQSHMQLRRACKRQGNEQSEKNSHANTRPRFHCRPRLYRSCFMRKVFFPISFLRSFRIAELRRPEV